VMPITSGRIRAEIQGPTTTGIALSNTSPQDAVISFYFTDVLGVDFGGNSFLLPAYHQVSGYLTQAPFLAPSPLNGTFTFSSSIPLGAVALRGFTNERSEFLMTAMPVSPLGSAQSGTLIPQVADGGGWTTDIVLTNSSEAPQSGMFQFFGQGSAQGVALLPVLADGMTDSTFYYWLPPRTSARLSTDGISAPVQMGSVRLTPTGEAPSATGILSFHNRGVTVSEAGVSGNSEGTAFQLYMEASGITGQIGAIQSGIAIANPSWNTVTTALVLTRLDGSSAGPDVNIDVPPGGQVTRFISDLFPGLPTPFQGILKLTASSNVAVVALRGRYNEREDFLITTAPPLNEASGATSDLIFPHIVDGVGYSTELTLFGQPGSGKIYLFSQEGVQKNGASLTIR